MTQSGIFWIHSRVLRLLPTLTQNIRSQTAYQCHKPPALFVNLTISVCWRCASKSSIGRGVLLPASPIDLWEKEQYHGVTLCCVRIKYILFRLLQTGIEPAARQFHSHVMYWFGNCAHCPSPTGTGFLVFINMDWTLFRTEIEINGLIMNVKQITCDLFAL